MLPSEKPAPTDPHQNEKFRRLLLTKARDDIELQNDLWIRCSRDPIFWANGFVYTFSPKEHPENPIRPFILYPYQDRAVRNLCAAIGREDRLIEKSRDMGASWMCMLAFVYRFLFFDYQSFLVISRKEDLVDKRGDPDALFWKGDMILDNLPSWMKPTITRNALHIANDGNHSVIDGESTNKDVSVGGRRTAILLDEFSKFDEFGHTVLRGTRDTTNCRIFNSTPAGASGAYYDIREKMRVETPDRIIRLHWSQHPDKAVGLYTTYDQRDNNPLKIIDTKYQFPANYKFIRDGKLRSPWYDEQCRRAANQQEIAQELDIDYAGSGWQYFEPAVIRDLAAKYCRPPDLFGEIVPGKDSEPTRWIEGKQGRLRLWCRPDAEGRSPPGDYVVSCDIANGVGGTISSNSVGTITNRKTGEKVGRWSSNTTEPREFARMMIALCGMFNNAFLIWERNGNPGSIFTNEVVTVGYQNIFFMEDETALEVSRRRKPGWHSNRETKQILLSSYRQAMMNGKFLNPDQEAVLETLDYVCLPTQEIIHTRSKGSIDPHSTGESHGDMVIADALAVRGMASFTEREAEHRPVEYPPNSIGGRLKAAVLRERQKSLY